MMSLRDWIFSAAVCCTAAACGARPDPPGRATPMASEGAVTLIETSQPSPEPIVEPVAAPAPAEAAADDAGAAPVDAPLADAAPPAEDVPSGTVSPAAGATLAMCLSDRGDCVAVGVAVVDVARNTCIELSIDNCGSATRQGLPVDMPVGWRLASASVIELSEECVPGAYDPDSDIIVDAAGSIAWNLETRRPSDLVLDVTLEPSSSALDTTPVPVLGTIPGLVPDCAS